jgi:hypothetical protein
VSAFDADVDVTVELGFGSDPLDPTPTYVDVSDFVRSAEWTRGRSTTMSTFPAGAGSVTLDNTDGRFYSFDTGSPYHPDVKVGVPIRIRAVHNSITYPEFLGYVSDWSSRFPTNREELIVLPIVETYARLIRKTIRRSFTTQKTDARVGVILDEANWPAGARNLDAGVADVATLVDEESTVGHRLVETELAEQGTLFQAADGSIRFKNRVANSGVTPAAVFGPSGADLTYTDVTYEDDEDFLYNEARVSAIADDDIADSQVTVIDATSAANHGTITYPVIDSIDIKGSTNAASVATWIVERHKELTKRITGLTVDPGGDPVNLWPEVLARDLRDVITVKVAFPGASETLTQNVTVEKIRHSFVAGDVWTTTYNLHPLVAFETQDFWILGTSLLSTGTRLA